MAGSADGVRVVVPATSANLGPGFDSFGLALALYDEVRVSIRPSGLEVGGSGDEAANVAHDDQHLVVQALRATFERLGGQPAGLAVHCAYRIPHGRGLGSSAAAIVAGVLAARALASRGRDLDDEAVLRLAADLEGHPDNVAACLHGGLTVTWAEDGRPRVLSEQVSPSVRPVVFVPQTRSATAESRRLLPASVPHADAAANAARAALLVTALTRRSDLLLAATEDRLHQRYRAAAMPATSSLVESLRRRGTAAVVSGAGPCVLALATEESVGDVARAADGSWRALPLDVAARGAEVTAGD